MFDYRCDQLFYSRAPWIGIFFINLSDLETALRYQPEDLKLDKKWLGVTFEHGLSCNGFTYSVQITMQ